MRSESFAERLSCRLTAQETLRKGAELVETMADKGLLELEIKEQTSTLKAQVKKLSQRSDALALEIRTGEEYRQVECTERRDFRNNLVDVVRMDTGEVVRSRPMTAGERQEQIDFARHEVDNDNDGGDDRMVVIGDVVPDPGESH